MTIALPLLISPVFIENKCYVDGGLMCNYPLVNCLNQECKPDLNEVLGFKNCRGETTNITEDSNIIEYSLYFISKLKFNLDTTEEKEHVKIPNEITYKDLHGLIIYKDALFSAEVRKEMYDLGFEAAKDFLLDRSI